MCHTSNSGYQTTSISSSPTTRSTGHGPHCSCHATKCHFANLRRRTCRNLVVLSRGCHSIGRCANSFDDRKSRVLLFVGTSLSTRRFGSQSRHFHGRFETVFSIHSGNGIGSGAGQITYEWGRDDSHQLERNGVSRHGAKRTSKSGKAFQNDDNVNRLNKLLLLSRMMLCSKKKIMSLDHHGRKLIVLLPVLDWFLIAHVDDWRYTPTSTTSWAGLLHFEWIRFTIPLQVEPQ